MVETLQLVNRGTPAPPLQPEADRAAALLPGPLWIALFALLLAGALVIASFVWQGRYGFDVGDEGYLWYGVQRVHAGEVPIRDFMSYDPGRYYWSAALTALLQDHGIMAVRTAVATFQLLGLFFALLLLARDRTRPDLWLVVLAAVTLLAWMYPRHKLFDISLSILLTCILAFLLRQPSQRRFFIVGIALGLVATFGINHGAYGTAGFAGAVVYLACLRRNLATLVPAVGLTGCGAILGYLPMIVAAIAVPGFARAFLDGILGILQRGTNLPLPVPWPWLVRFSDVPVWDAAAAALTGAFFIAILAFGLLSVLWIIRRALQQRPVQPEFIACSVLALPYAHFAFSRADVPHLAQAIFPFLLGVFILLKHWPATARRLAALALTAASLTVMLPLHPGWQCRAVEPCSTVDVAGNDLVLNSATAGILAMLTEVTGTYAANGRDLFVTVWPGAYAALQRRSPIWEIYALFPQGETLQRREIERIKTANIGLVLILNVAVDGREDLRFRNTHPLLEHFIRDNFDAITIPGWDPQVFQFYKSR
jgi:hypothetical protein